ncbi:NAD(P)-dependent oxidoreductase [uncultured Erythrobacter sp.]|uniref:siroheme synthase n=1 Tax=uncultured Erythrobacter sp. TaxID=263913 RepID=UPI0026299E59|nr:NAD(P)-dependent oxidoreductase [uncultured Erythrobacter sp.]
MSELASLPLFHKIAGERVLVLGEGAAAEPKRRLVERAGGIIEDDQQRAIDEGIRIAFVAYEDAKACEVAAINLRCAGMLVNVVDRPELCDFTTPSILDRNPVLIAVGTGGASAGLAKHIRLRLERILPRSLGDLARKLFAARPALREIYPDSGDRRRALDNALREGGALDAMASQSVDRVEGWLKGTVQTKAVHKETFTVTSQDPEDLTIKQARLLGEADIVCADSTISSEILARSRADAVRVVCEKSASCESGRCPLTEAEAKQGGLTVVLRNA